MIAHIADIWHDTVVTKILAALEALITRAQNRGEIVEGDPRLLAFSVAGPILMGLLFREVFDSAAAASPDLEALATQHARILLNGVAIPKDK